VGAGLGAGLNAIAGEDVFKGATSGAIGAIAAETIAEILSGGPDGFMTQMKEREKNEGRRLTQREVQDLILEETHRNANWSKIGSTLVTLLSGQDVNVGAAAANNAIDNNFLIFAYYGAVAAGIAWTAYDFIDTLENEGLEPALYKLGIDTAIGLAGGAALKVGGKAAKYVFKGKPYKTVKAVLAAALENRPALKLVLGKTIEKIAAMGEAFENSIAGKAISKIERKIENKVSNWREKFDDLIDHDMITEASSWRTGVSGSGFEASNLNSAQVNLHQMVYGPYTHFSSTIREGNVSFSAYQRIKGNKMILTDINIGGPGAGSSSTGELRKIVREYGREHGVGEVIIRGTIRDTGANVGHISRDIRLKVD
jgi:hypothetical protein